jgi:hypothetical protein
VIVAVSVGLIGVFLAGCGDTGDLGGVPVDSDAGDDQPQAVLDADLPQADLVIFTDAGDTDNGDTDDAAQDAPDAEVVELEAGSITTCGQFFECVQDCGGRSEACMGPCNDAMTEEAATAVHRFMNCVAQNSCRDAGCIAQRCGQESQTCFASPY